MIDANNGPQIDYASDEPKKAVQSSRRSIPNRPGRNLFLAAQRMESNMYDSVIGQSY